MSCTKNIYIVYVIINLINRKYYIGSHTQKKRFGPYEFDGYWGSSYNPEFHNDFKKYGESNFMRATLFHGFKTRRKCDDFEKFIIGEKWRLDECYNKSSGGKYFGICNKGKKYGPMSDERKEKISRANKGKIRTQEMRDRISVAAQERCKKLGSGFKGKSHSKEAIRKNREAHKGTHWWTNGKENKFCKLQPVGFYRGRTIQ